MNLAEICADQIKAGVPLNKLRRDLDYAMPDTIAQMMHELLLEHSSEIFTNENGDRYRVVHLENETRLEFLDGVPYMDMPDKWDAPVTSVDFTYDKKEENYLKSFMVRKGQIRYRFRRRAMQRVISDLMLLKTTLSQGKGIIISHVGNIDRRVLVTNDGWVDAPKDLVANMRMVYGPIGMWGDQLVLHHSVVV